MREEAHIVPNGEENGLRTLSGCPKVQVCKKSGFSKLCNEFHILRFMCLSRLPEHGYDFMNRKGINPSHFTCEKWNSLLQAGEKRNGVVIREKQD